MGFLMMLDPDGEQVQGGTRWYRLPDPPTVPLLAGPPVTLVAVAPSDAVAGEQVPVLLRAVDRWGNAVVLPASGSGDAVAAAAPAVEARDLVTDAPVPAASAGPAEPGADARALRLPIVFGRPGTIELTVTLPSVDVAPLVARSNPVLVSQRVPTPRLHWGDLHAGQSAVGCGAGSVAGHYAHARHVAGLQFVTEQSNDHYVTLEGWRHLRREAERFYEPGAFVTFLGCEWSAETPDGGDRNVYYRHDEPRLRRSGRFFQETDPDPEPDLATAVDFHRAFRNEAVLVNMHVGGRPTNLDWHVPEIERLIEIHSTHGTIEWFVADALERGFRVGITAGTDGVMGRPGADHPGWGLVRNLPNGLTAVYADALTRDGLWRALQQRCCYATTGERILLWFDVDGHPMGSAFETGGPPTATLRTVGTGPIHEVDLLRGTTLVAHWCFASTAQAEPGQRWLELAWRGTRRRGSAQAQRLDWSGSLRLAGARLLEVVPLGFYGPDDEVRVLDEETLSWSSATAGNEAGVRQRLHGGDDARAWVEAGPTSLEVRLGDVARAPRIVRVPGVDARLKIGPAAGAGGPRIVERSFTDDAAVEGTAPYWVRVTQADRAKAWSSPVYVTRHRS